MTTVLHLGVVDMPYSDKTGTTTGQVAEWLEDKYHVMEIFYETHQDMIGQALADAMGDAISNMMMGAPMVADPYAAADAQIESAFRKFLTSREIETLGYPGVPTLAAIEGVSSRFKSRRGPRRPSFVDSGLYEAAFKIWAN